MKPASPTRGRLSPDAIRDELTELGLREEIESIPGYGFTYRKEPHAAVAFWKGQHGDAEPTRFYLHPRMYVLSD